MRRIPALGATALLCVASAGATPFWVSWTGDDYPENQGWSRYASDPPPARWLSDGSLFIDSRADWWLYEEYEQYPGALLPPGPGEIFVARWRLCILELYTIVDPGVYVNFGRGEVSLLYAYALVESAFEPGKHAVLDPPGEFHEFELRSHDMLNYTLEIDGAPGFGGVFWQGPPVTSLVGWGDVGSHRSLSQWDYFEFGVVAQHQLGDLNCDGAIDAFDIDPFVAALTDPEGYSAREPGCDRELADANQDGSIDVFDIDPFVELLVGRAEEQK